MTGLASGLANDLADSVAQVAIGAGSCTTGST